MTITFVHERRRSGAAPPLPADFLAGQFTENAKAAELRGWLATVSPVHP
jgi:hypothetical protein